MKTGRIIYIKDNGLKRTGETMGLESSMLKMQGKKFRITNTSDAGVKVGGFWFDKYDVVLASSLKPKEVPKPVYFDTQNLDT